MAQHDPDVELAQTFAEVARSLLEEDEVDSTLHRICDLAVQTVPACQAVGVSIVEGQEITNLSTTNDVPGILDGIQSEMQEGPCIDAIREREVFITGALSHETRWPKFAPRAHEETGVESILSVRLFAGEDTMGALNLYSEQRDAFDDHDVALALVFAAHAAVALDSAQREQQLEAKAATRDVIGMAKGIIMARQDVTDEDAFEILRRASQRMNVKLREIAERLVNPAASGQTALGE